MSNSRLATALLAGHILVASVAWTMGFLAGRLCQRRNDVDEVFGPDDDDLDWLVHHLEALQAQNRPYNWVVDGECRSSAEAS